MGEVNFIAVPTAYNIYRVKGDVLQSASGMMAVMPAAVVMETLVMQGQAKVVARIKPYDLEMTEDGSIELSDRYDPEESEEDVAHDLEETENIQLPGPWWTDEDEDA